MAKQSGEIETRQQITGAFRREPIVGRVERYSFHGNSISPNRANYADSGFFSSLCVARKTIPESQYACTIRSAFILPC